MTTTIIIITLDRPAYLERCLACLGDQTLEPDQVIVVDASSGDETRRLVERNPRTEYIHNAAGIGRMTSSRNLGLARATGDLVAFLDDDSFARPNWLASLAAAYEVNGVAAVGGRALVSGTSPHFGASADCIGRLTADGLVIGTFDADPGRTIDVDHVIGCNMSFRRDVLAELGGFREDYTGVSGVREDTDVCLRIRRLGYRLVFAPQAVVDHVGAGQVIGNRFDLRYDYFTQRNHLALLVRNFGAADPIVRRYLRVTWTKLLADANSRVGAGRVPAAAARLGVNVAGLGAGLVLGLRALVRFGADPIRRDDQGERLRRTLSYDHQTPSAAR